MKEAKPEVLEDSNFQSTIDTAETPVLIDFWAPWCGPCQMLGPIIEEVAEEVSDKAKVYKVNVDENPETAGKYNIMSIPTVMLFKQGEPQETIVGVQSKDTYVEAIGKYLEDSSDSE
ncbi:thioredoxin [Candidatus Dojkabacteria bacterium]|nr:thioredoxin [Candidatus Dojkabacteria bacterium]